MNGDIPIFDFEANEREPVKTMLGKSIVAASVFTIAMAGSALAQTPTQIKQFDAGAPIAISQAMARFAMSCPFRRRKRLLTLIMAITSSS